MPATGYRNATTGAMTNVGTNGYAWSSSSYYAGNYNVGFLNFNSTNVNPLNNTWRAHGMPVRCVQYLHEAAIRPFGIGFPATGSGSLLGGQLYIRPAAELPAILGRTHTSDCFFRPATGYRHRETGVLANVGTGGYAWSSSSDYAAGADASRMGFLATVVFPLSSDRRAHGYSVRCVQHLCGDRLCSRSILRNGLRPGVAGATVSVSAVV